MDIQESIITMPLCVVICHEDQTVSAKYCGIETKLYKKLNARLRYDATNPRAEMVHLSYTAINFAAVMSPVRLEVQTGRAEWWPAIVIAYEDLF
jgi:hypothetical protein